MCYVQVQVRVPPPPPHITSHNFGKILSRNIYQTLKKVYQKNNININRTFETPGNFGCPKGVEKSELFCQESYHSQNFKYETIKSPLLKKLSVLLLPHVV